MASISSLMGGTSSASSLYGNRNVISGLASGMDTEAMIENAVSGYNMKIASLKQDYTMLEWQQSALRSIISKMNNFSSKYLAYTSSTNLLSQSFFNSAVNVSAQGENASKVSATGKTSSTVKVLGVKQLASAASHSVKGIGGGASAQADESTSAIKGEAVDLTGPHRTSKVAGSLTLKQSDGSSVSISFAADEVYTSEAEFVDAINSKLEEADSEIRAEQNGTSITFSDGSGGEAWISKASGNIAKNLGITASADYSDESASITVDDATALYNEETNAEYLSKQKMTFTLNGVSKSITLSGVAEATTMDEVQTALQTELNKAFGENKITVGQENGGLTFTLNEQGSTLAIGNGEAMGLASSNETTYINAGKTLGDLVNLGSLTAQDQVALSEDEAAKYTQVTEDNVTYLTDDKGNKVAVQDGDTWYKTDSNGDVMYDLKINGESVGEFSKNSTLNDVLTAINKSSGVSVSHSTLTDSFQFTSKETGAAGRISIEGGLGAALFGEVNVAGQDAILAMEVNGETVENVTRSSNTFDVDGMKITLNGTFNYDADGNRVTDTEAVTFKSESDVDAIVDAIKSMVNDYNEMATEIKNAYSTMPQYDSSGDRYKPLTEEDQAEMSESAVKNYEEKAKQGILFADRDLNSLYTSLTNAFNSSGLALKDIGINIAYEEGTTTLVLDESKLRTTLETDPDKVRDVLAGDGTKDTALQKVATTLDKYGKVTGTKGILVERAGTPLSSSSMLNNQMLTEMNEINEKIERWQDKLADQVDYYTRQFTALEQLILEMNSQSSALMGLMGG